MSEIKIDINEFQNAVKKLKSISTDIKFSLTQIQNASSSIDKSWNGNSAAKFQLNSIKVSNDIKTTSSYINGLANDLNSVVKIFKEQDEKISKTLVLK